MSRTTFYIILIVVIIAIVLYVYRKQIFGKKENGIAAANGNNRVAVQVVTEGGALTRGRSIGNIDYIRNTNGRSLIRLNDNQAPPAGTIDTGRTVKIRGAGAPYDGEYKVVDVWRRIQRGAPNQDIGVYVKQTFGLQAGEEDRPGGEALLLG